VSVVVTRKDRRLRIIAVEDVGLGVPVGPVLIDVLHRNFNDTPGSDWMMACHADRDPSPRRGARRV